jgi:hypothetical protein
MMSSHGEAWVQRRSLVVVAVVVVVVATAAIVALSFWVSWSSIYLGIERAGATRILPPSNSYYMPCCMPPVVAMATATAASSGCTWKYHMKSFRL